MLTGAVRPEAGLARMCDLLIDPATQGPAVDLKFMPRATFCAASKPQASAGLKVAP